MKRQPLHVFYLIALLCALLAPANGRAGDVLTGKQQGEACVSRSDGHLRLMTEERQRPLTVQSGRLSPRVASSRPSHGPKPPGRHIGKCTESLSYHILKTSFLRLSLGRLSARAGAASPRSYYVIALRRLLC